MLLAFSSKNTAFSRGFTLTEMMVVTCIILILASLSVFPLASLTASKKLNQTMEMITHGTAVARQTAVSDGAPVAFIISTNPSNSNQQALLFLEGTISSTGGVQWNAVSPWQFLPQEIRTTIFQRNGLPSFYHSTTSGPLTGALPLAWAGSKITDYSYIIFRPDGTVDSPAPGASLSMVRVNQPNLSFDYIVLVEENSGRSKVIQP